jgi:hypothetical protein
MQFKLSGGDDKMTDKAANTALLPVGRKHDLSRINKSQSCDQAAAGAEFAHLVK